MEENARLKNNYLENKPKGWLDKIKSTFKKGSNQDYELPKESGNIINPKVYSGIGCKEEPAKAQPESSDNGCVLGESLKKDYFSVKKSRMADSFEWGDNEKCIECSSKNIKINRENCWVCGDCGLEYELNYQSDKMTGESRAFDSDEIISRKRTEVKHAGFGARTTIGNYYDYSKISPKIKGAFIRMRRLQNQRTNYSEASFRQASSMLKRLTYNLELANCVERTALTIYKSVCKKKLMRGNSIEDFISASLYTAIRVHKTPRLLDEVIEYSDIDEKNINEKKVNSAVRIIVKNILPDLNLKFLPASPIPYINKFGQELKLTDKEINTACEIYASAKKKGLNSCGKDPKGLAAASIYIGALKMGKGITQNVISKISGVTEVTIRNRTKDFNI
jgi:transcription initiation factor TFIIB